MALNLVVDAQGDRKVEIDPALCNGCGICAQLCKEDAIVRPEPAEGGKA
jgi:TPP-dependent indolepyruvate ferredoxin oxidoreductase alpha subunit